MRYVRPGCPLCACTSIGLATLLLLYLPLCFLTYLPFWLRSCGRVAQVALAVLRVGAGLARQDVTFCPAGPPHPYRVVQQCLLTVLRVRECSGGWRRLLLWFDALLVFRFSCCGADRTRALLACRCVTSLVRPLGCLAMAFRVCESVSGVYLRCAFMAARGPRTLDTMCGDAARTARRRLSCRSPRRLERCLGQFGRVRMFADARRDWPL